MVNNNKRVFIVIVPLVLNNGYEYRVDILSCIQERLHHVLQSNRKVMVVRFDMRFPRDYPHNGRNDEISEMMRRLTDHYNYHGVKMSYIWAREQNTSDVPHYHVIVFVTGSYVRDGWSLVRKSIHYYNGIVGGNYGACIHHCHTREGNGEIIIRQPSSPAEEIQVAAQRDAVLEWASYLAKTRTKGNAPYRVREYQGSQI